MYRWHPTYGRKQEELKNLLMKVKEQSEKADLKLNIQKTKIMASNLISSVESLSCVWPFETPWTAACQTSLSITNFQSLLNLMSIESMMLPNHLNLCYPLLPCLQSFPASGSFPMRQFFASGCQSIGASASVLPMNINDCFISGLTCLMNLQSKGHSRVFSNTTVQKHQFLCAQLSL